MPVPSKPVRLNWVPGTSPDALPAPETPPTAWAVSVCVLSTAPLALVNVNAKDPAAASVTEKDATPLAFAALVIEHRNQVVDLLRDQPIAALGLARAGKCVRGAQLLSDVRA